MAEDKEKRPSWNVGKNMSLNESVILTLEKAIPTANGTNNGKFGKKNWFLWLAETDKLDVWDKEAKKEIKGHKGKIVVFPNDATNEQFIAVCAGEEGVKIKITKSAQEGTGKGKGKLFTNYVIEKLEGGKTLNRDEDNFVKDLKNLKAEKIEVTIESMLEYAKDYKIDSARAIELYKRI